MNENLKFRSGHFPNHFMEMKERYEIFWALFGCLGATAKYFNDVVEGKRKFHLRELSMLIFSGSFVAWLIAKISFIALGISADLALIIAGISGVVGFGATVALLDKYISKLFR